jgi:hypothetical protein
VLSDDVAALAVHDGDAEVEQPVAVVSVSGSARAPRHRTRCKQTSSSDATRRTRRGSAHENALPSRRSGSALISGAARSRASCSLWAGAAIVACHTTAAAAAPFRHARSVALSARQAERTGGGVVYRRNGKPRRHLTCVAPFFLRASALLAGTLRVTVTVTVTVAVTVAVAIAAAAAAAATAALACFIIKVRATHRRAAQRVRVR